MAVGLPLLAAHPRISPPPHPTPHFLPHPQIQEQSLLGFPWVHLVLTMHLWCAATFWFSDISNCPHSLSLFDLQKPHLRCLVGPFFCSAELDMIFKLPLECHFKPQQPLQETGRITKGVSLMLASLCSHVNRLGFHWCSNVCASRGRAMEYRQIYLKMADAFGRKKKHQRA